MTHHEWLTSTDPAAMLREVTGVFPSHRAQMTPYASARQLRLFAVACCRAVWDRLVDPRSRRAVEVAERFADGLATEEERTSACSETTGVWGEWPAFRAANRDATVAAHEMVGLITRSGSDEPDQYPPPETQAALLRTIIGDPFSPVTIDPHCRTPDVLAIASRIYDDRDWDAMPMLADALQEAGCEDVRVLEWLRGDVECVACGGAGGQMYSTACDPRYGPVERWGGCGACLCRGRIKPARCRGDHVLDAILGRE